MTNYLTLKDLRTIVADCSEYSDDMPVLIATKEIDTQDIPDTIYSHRLADNFRYVPAEYVERFMPAHEKDGAIEIILMNANN